MHLQKLFDFSGPLALLGILAALVGAIPSNALAQKVKLDDLIKGHLESIGSAESRSAAENLLISGTGSIVCQRGCVGNIEGPATVASAMGKRLLAMKFNNLNYPGERFLFNGKNVEVARLPSTQYSVLGLFFYQYNMLLREGLVGGTLTLGWPFLDLENTNPKLRYRGLKKMDGRQLHQVEFSPRKGRSDFTIHLYFEPDTFRHVISRYRTSLDGLAGANTRYTIVEKFSDFIVEDGLTLPHSYEMQFESHVHLLTWRMELTGFQTSQEIDPAMFDVMYGEE